MVSCKFCKKEMLEADGCVRVQIPYTDEDPVRFGSETRFGDDFGQECVENPDRRCRDCGALPGKFHHSGCDIEECPVCGHQIISCECGDDE
ncbi:hypothetical protein GOV11_00800 [Candidatus Woesearchaeota archaeon]|nr:hypothetical protein [Candidatus Woesearchaeota archaeon]